MKKIITLLITILIITACNSVYHLDPVIKEDANIEVPKTNTSIMYLITGMEERPLNFYCTIGDSYEIRRYEIVGLTYSTSFSQSTNTTNYCSVFFSDLYSYINLNLILYVDGVEVDRAFPISGSTNISVQYRP